MSKHDKKNYNRSERYLREEESENKHGGNNIQNNIEQNNYNTKKKCWNKNCSCNGGLQKYCK